MPPASGRWRLTPAFRRFRRFGDIHGIEQPTNSAGDAPALHPATPRQRTGISPACIWRSRRNATFSATTAIVKYHCSNESRPGVVAELLEPDQAIRKALAVGAAIPHLAVIGVAGPGDPLANPEPVFATLRELREQAPDLLLCLSTNGLALPEHADTLAEHGIHHVTITINCVDPTSAPRSSVDRLAGPPAAGTRSSRHIDRRNNYAAWICSWRAA